ncbi:hypothetical protein FXW78_23965 [Rhodococcus opacus]|nr:hypothetical protein [Rhodococcus opacus]
MEVSPQRAGRAGVPGDSTAGAVLVGARRSHAAAGFSIDVTESLDIEVRESVEEAVTDMARSRAAIDQEKAMTLTSGISPDRAFDVLVWALAADGHQPGRELRGW